MKSIRLMFFMFTIFFLFITNGLACNSYQLNQIKNNVESQKDTLSLRNYNYNYLTQTKNELLNEKKFLENCLHNGVKDLLNIQTLLKNPDNVSKSEQQHLEFIQQNTQKTIDIIHYNLNQINHLIILIDDRLNFAKDYTDNRNQKKDIVHLIKEGNFVKPTVKTFDEVFPLVFQGYTQHPKLFVFNFACLFLPSFMSLYFLKKYLKKYLKKHKDNIKNYFYENNKYSIFIFFPLAGLFYLIYYDANSWLIQPPGLVFIRWALIMLSINFFSNFYLCFLTNIVDNNLLQSLHQTIQKIIYSLFCVGIIQYISLNHFNESDIIELLYLIFVVPIFDFFFMYFCIQFILKLTTPYFFPSTSLLTLKIYRYLGILFLISYTIIRSGGVYLGFQLFSTAQVIFCIIIFFYFFKYLHFIRHIKTNLPHDLQIIWNKLKAFFGAKSQDKLVEIEVIVTLMNIIILYNLIVLCSYILTIPEYYLYIFKRFINQPIILSTLNFSVINIFKAIFAFCIIDLFGKFVACRVTQQPSYANDIDKKLTVNIIIHYAFYILATLISLLFFGLSSAHISVIIGTIGVGLGIGAQYIIHNIISGVIIITKKMIHVGDFITIQNIAKVHETTTGKIEKISILSTQILDEDQLLVNVPNSYILENCVVNYTSSENINTCYINLKIKNTQEYHDIVNQIIEIIKGFSEIIQDYPYGPAVKLLQSITKEDQDYRNINISFSVSNPTEKQFIYSQIKNEILKKLKNQIFIDKKPDVI